MFIQRKDIPLIVGIAIPLIMILSIVGMLYVPFLFAHPTINFLYTDGEDYWNSFTYRVVNGKVVMQPPSDPTSDNGPTARLYIYQVEKDSSREISFADAQTLKLDTQSKSPEGFEVREGGQDIGIFPFFFGNRNYGNWYLQGHGVSRKINKNAHNYSGTGNLHFLGWILP